MSTKKTIKALDGCVAKVTVDEHGRVEFSGWHLEGVQPDVQIAALEILDWIREQVITRNVFVGRAEMISECGAVNK